MLYQFLVAERERVLALARSKTAVLSENRPTSKKSEEGLPQFYDYLVRELTREANGHPKRSERKHGLLSTGLHGEEMSRLGYTVSQVVHGYGALCQAITELAESADISITAGEFSALNLSLDVAIADAVTGFTRRAHTEGVDASQRMGFLVHELRNALAAAIVAHSLVKKGVVGIGGSTSILLERNLNRMRDILDRSFSEVRLHSDSPAHREPVRLLDVIEEVEATTSEEARLRGLSLQIDSPVRLDVEADRNDLISALSNLVQNAVKYSHPGGIIRVRGRETAKHVLLEVEDACGGLPKGKAEELFHPFIQKNSDRTGLGLGLTISRQAVEHNGGTLTVRDLVGKGCVFAISFPRRSSAPSSAGAHKRPVARRS